MIHCKEHTFTFMHRQRYNTWNHKICSGFICIVNWVIYLCKMSVCVIHVNVFTLPPRHLPQSIFFSFSQSNNRTVPGPNATHISGEYSSYRIVSLSCLSSSKMMTFLSDRKRKMKKYKLFEGFKAQRATISQPFERLKKSKNLFVSSYFFLCVLLPLPTHKKGK